MTIPADYDTAFDLVKIRLFSMGCVIDTLQKDEGYIQAWTTQSTFLGQVKLVYRLMLVEGDGWTRVRAQIFFVSGPAAVEAPGEYYAELWGGLAK
jgi:hypothetical protein